MLAIRRAEKQFFAYVRISATARTFLDNATADSILIFRIVEPEVVVADADEPACFRV